MADQSIYARLGGEASVRNLVEVFYDVVEQEPEGAPLMILHLRGHGVTHSRIAQFNFLAGLCGGPKLYTQQQGHSHIRKMQKQIETNAKALDD